MNKLLVPLATVILSVPLLATAQEQVSRDLWTEHMKSAVADLLCQDDSYFVQCFELNLEQCHTSLSQLTTQCLERFADDLPDPIRLPDQGVILGQMVGSCAGSQFELVNQSVKIQSQRCSDPSYWSGR